MLKYYLALGFITPQKITLKLNNIANFILYILLFLFFKNNIENNKVVFLYNNDPLYPINQDKRKKPI